MSDTTASSAHSTAFDLGKPAHQAAGTAKFPARLALLALLALLGLLTVLVLGVAYLAGFRPDISTLFDPMRDAGVRLAGWWSEWAASSPVHATSPVLAAPPAAAPAPAPAPAAAAAPALTGGCGPAEFASFVQEAVRMVDGVFGKVLAGGMLFLGSVAAVARASVVPAMLSVVHAVFILYAPGIILGILGC